MTADPPDVNCLAPAQPDPRVVANVVDGHYFTTDPRHMWLCPFRDPARGGVWLRLPLAARTRVSMLRIWNYNRGRVGAARGARWVRAALDGAVVFEGEVRRAPGSLSVGLEPCAEVVLFTLEESVLEVRRARTRTRTHAHGRHAFAA